MQNINSLIVKTHPQWHEILKKSLSMMDISYLKMLENDSQWLPGKECLLKAFTLPLQQTRFILLGESPYPRKESANGLAFCDAAVGEIWSKTGLSKGVNKATSLRNIIKMLLYARKDLGNDFSQGAISRLEKKIYVQTLEELFNNFMNEGVLLLNASLVFSQGQVQFHAKHWRVFINALLNELVDKKSDIQLILFGNIAKKVTVPLSTALIAEHPFNLSFITNQEVVNFFKPLELLTVK